MPDGNIKVLVEGVERARATEVNDVDGFFVATVRTGKTQLELTPQVEQLMQRVHSLFEQYVKLQQSLNYETMAASVRADEPAKLADTIAANLQLSIEEKQQLLEVFDPETRLSQGRRRAGRRDREAEHGPHHSVAREAADGEGAERVLPQREDQGDPEGAWAAARSRSSTS